MGQSMVAIEEVACTGCDLCIPFCPFEALLPLANNPRTKGKRPLIVVESHCVGCLSCIGSCPTGALEEVILPEDSMLSPLMVHRSQENTQIVKRFKKGGEYWPRPRS